MKKYMTLAPLLINLEQEENKFIIVTNHLQIPNGQEDRGTN